MSLDVVSSINQEGKQIPLNMRQYSILIRKYNMVDIAKVLAGLGCIGLGFYGYNTDITGSGWLVFLGVICILDIDARRNKE